MSPTGVMMAINTDRKKVLQTDTLPTVRAMRPYSSGVLK
jgi:hypothetical protein